MLPLPLWCRLLARGIECLVSPQDLPPSQWHDIYTDNNPLTYVLTSAKLDACGQRWVAKLANYNFTIRYRSGQSNCYIVGLDPNCKFIDLLFKRLVITFIKISFLNCFIVSEIIYSQTDTLTEELMYLR